MYERREMIMAQKNELQETARIDALFEKVSLCRRFFMVYSNSVNSDYPIQKEIGKQRLSNSSAVLTNIYATQYQLYLPDKDLLQAKVREWIAEFKETNGDTE